MFLWGCCSIDDLFIDFDDLCKGVRLNSEEFVLSYQVSYLAVPEFRILGFMAIEDVHGIE